MNDASLRGFGTGTKRFAAHIPVVIAIATAMSLVSARLTAAALFIWLIVVAIEAVRTDRWQNLVPERGAVIFSLSAFLGFAFLSLLWAEAGSHAVAKLISVTAIGASALFISSWFGAETSENARAAAFGLAIGFAIGLVYLLIELSTGQAIQIAVYNTLNLPRSWMQPERHFFWKGDTLVGMEPSHINRSLAVASLLAFPAALSAYVCRQTRWSAALAAAIVPAAGFAAALSRHESSMAALVVGVIVFALAWVSALWAGRLLAAGWVVAIVAVVPLALLAGRGKLENIPWLHHSLAHRFIIWNYTAEETLKSPIIGIGAYMTYVLGPERNKDAAPEPGEKYKKTLSRHAHNAYLQTWYEMGAIGAALLLASGLSVLAAIRRLADRAQPFALATFATAATMLSSSYGIWQTWYLALFGLTAVGLATAVRAMDERSQERG